MNRHQVEDKNAQVMITLSAVYGSYMLANTLHVSGIVAVAILGLSIGKCYRVIEASS